MSCYICEPETIKTVVAFAELCHDDTNRPYWAPFGPQGWRWPEGSDERAEYTADRCAELWRLNCAAFSARYNGRHDDTIPAMPTNWWRVDSHNTRDGWQMLKTLDCYLYQCDCLPGENATLAAIQCWAHKLARYMVTLSTEYAAANWR